MVWNASSSFLKTKSPSLAPRIVIQMVGVQTQGSDPRVARPTRAAYRYLRGNTAWQNRRLGKEAAHRSIPTAAAETKSADLRKNRGLSCHQRRCFFVAVVRHRGVSPLGKLPALLLLLVQVRPALIQGVQARLVVYLLRCFPRCLLAIARTTVGWLHCNMGETTAPTIKQCIALHTCGLDRRS